MGNWKQYLPLIPMLTEIFRLFQGKKGSKKIARFELFPIVSRWIEDPDKVEILRTEFDRANQLENFPVMREARMDFDRILEILKGD